MTIFVCICTRRQIPGILCSSVFGPEICHFCVDFYTIISLPPNFCYNVYLWMNYRCASFHNFLRPLSRFFRKVFIITPRRWFAPNIFTQRSKMTPQEGCYYRVFRSSSRHRVPMISKSSSKLSISKSVQKKEHKTKLELVSAQEKSFQWCSKLNHQANFTITPQTLQST